MFITRKSTFKGNAYTEAERQSKQDPKEGHANTNRKCHHDREAKNQSQYVSGS